MQDNPIDPKWEDQGWEMMRQLLDQEMPLAGHSYQVARAQQTKRIGLAVALTTLAALAAYWWGGEYLTSAKPDHIAAFAIPQTPAPEATLTLPEEATGTTSPVPSARPAYNRAIDNITTEPKNNTLIQPKVHTATTVSSREPAVTPAADGNPPTPAMEHVSRVQAGPLLAALPGSGSGAVETLNTAFPTLPAKDFNTKPRPAVHYGLEAGLGTTSFDQLQARTIAGFASFDLLPNGLWYSRISAGYTQIDQVRTLSEQQFVFSNTRFREQAPNMEGPAILNARTQLEQLSYIFLQPNVGHWLHPRIGVEAGIQYAYLLSANTATRWSSDAKDPVDNPSDSPEETLLENLPSTLTQKSEAALQRHQFSLQIGLRYRISTKLSFGFHWQQGLNSIVPANTPLYNRFCQASVAYTLR